MKTIPIAVPSDTYYRAPIWAAKNTISVSSIVGKILRQIAQQTPTGTLPALFIF